MEEIDMMTERKSNNQLMSKTDQKPKDKKQRSDHSIHTHPQRPLKDNSLKECHGRPVQPKAPLHKQEEAMVKCKNCGAFGHTARSKRCPIKNWAHAFPVKPLGSNQVQESLKPRKPQQFQTSGLVSKTDRVKEDRRSISPHEFTRPYVFTVCSWGQGYPRSQVQGDLRTMAASEKVQDKTSKIHGGFAASLTIKQELGSIFIIAVHTTDVEVPTLLHFFILYEDYIKTQKHTRPAPVHTTKKSTSVGPASAGQPPVQTSQTSDRRSFCPTSSYNKKLEKSTCGSVKGHGIDFPDSLQPAFKSGQDTALHSKMKIDGSGVSFHNIPQLSQKTASPGFVFNSQAHIKCPNVDSKPNTQPVRQKCGQDAKDRIPSAGKPVQVSTPTCQSLRKKPCLNSFLTPQLDTDVGVLQIYQPPTSTCGIGTQQTPQETTNSRASKPHAPLQLPPCSPPLQVSAVSQPQLFMCAPRAPGRTGSMGQDKAHKYTPAGQSPHVLMDSERLGPHVQRSVLYEDLMVSSSEDSDGE
uniref:protein FAM90A27P-like n=1 Tax=Jaculus jaculus TaxID=51337 RepID=UPI001E1AF590|nr:protein FAM90A27P-like [Jaculus jaculus]